MDLLKCRYDKSQVGYLSWGRIPERYYGLRIVY